MGRESWRKITLEIPGAEGKVIKKRFEKEAGALDWINLDEDNYKRQAVVNAVMK